MAFFCSALIAMVTVAAVGYAEDSPFTAGTHPLLKIAQAKFDALAPLERAELRARAAAIESDGETALNRAAAEGDAGAVAMWLVAGAPVDGATSDLPSPLIAAARGGHETVVALLISAGADVNHTSIGRGMVVTPILGTLESENLNIMRALVAAGAASEIGEPGGETIPLMWALVATEHMDPYLIALLLAAGITATESGPDGLSPVEKADALGHKEVAAFLRRGEVTEAELRALSEGWPARKRALAAPSRAASACRNNLRQLSLVLALYANAHDGKLPLSFVEMYPAHLSDLSVLVCPTDSQELRNLANRNGTIARHEIEAGITHYASYELTLPGGDLHSPNHGKDILVREKNHLPHHYVLFRDGRVERAPAR